MQAINNRGVHDDRSKWSIATVCHACTFWDISMFGISLYGPVQRKQESSTQDYQKVFMIVKFGQLRYSMR
jgi:hypothetical protein